MINKLNYALQMLLKSFNKKYHNCPSCQSSNNYKFTGKEFNKFPTSLRYCKDCKLLFRFPVTLASESELFYKDRYHEAGLTTDLPSKTELKYLIDTNFKNTEKDFSIWMKLFRDLSIKLNKKIRILDYGANWGYTVAQLSKEDFVEKAVGYEYSLPRAEFGKKNLNIEYLNEDMFSKSFDVVFSSHVIEHMFNPSKFKNHMNQLLVDEGYCVVACPNGSLSAMLKNPVSFKSMRGEVHPNYISDLYLLNQFSDYHGAVFDYFGTMYDEMLDEPGSFNYLKHLNSPPVSFLPDEVCLIGIFQRKDFHGNK